MLLVFTPALYCDTSDSWMLPSRWQRAAVGLAGIGSEVLLAALATFVWVSTGPGLIHYVAMNVMLVGSVSTVLFNANPLLRYDGYFVLSDLCDVPNLSERSRSLLMHGCAKWMMGVDDAPPEALSAAGRFWMLAYAITAAVYRWGLTLLILWVVSLMLRPHGLESLGRMLCGFAAMGLLYALLRRPVRFVRDPSRRRMLKMKRMCFSGCLLLGLIVLACVPIPAGVSASARIVPRQETTIYITTPGRLGAVAARPGATVTEGDEVATLVNRDVEMQYLAAQGRFEVQQQLVDAIRRSQFQSAEAAQQLPAAVTLLQELQQQWQTRQQRRAALVLRAPASGKLIAAPRRPVDSHDDLQLVSWSGYPTDPENQDCYLESGMELMSIVKEDQWDAELVLSQSQVQRFSQGASVKLVCELAPQTVLRGKVTDISRARWSEGENAQRRDDRRATRRDAPPSTSYVVRVELQPSADSPLIVAATASARIEADPISLLGRASRFLNGLLRFR
jgi:putative peptide zinc metalloprotease protein